MCVISVWGLEKSVAGERPKVSTTVRICGYEKRKMARFIVIRTNVATGQSSII